LKKLERLAAQGEEVSWVARSPWKVKMDWDRSAKEIYHTAGVVSESKS